MLYKTELLAPVFIGYQPVLITFSPAFGYF